VQEVPYRWQALESPALRERLGVPTNTSGVAVTAVSALSAVGVTSAAAAVAPPPGTLAAERGGTGGGGTGVAGGVVGSGVVGTATTVNSSAACEECGLLRVDDVITAIDGHALGDDHTVSLRPGEIVRADYLITSKPALTYMHAVARTCTHVSMQPALTYPCTGSTNWHDDDLL
jgi:hypothetical protein